MAVCDGIAMAWNTVKYDGDTSANDTASLYPMRHEICDQDLDTCKS